MPLIIDFVPKRAPARRRRAARDEAAQCASLRREGSRPRSPGACGASATRIGDVLYVIGGALRRSAAVVGLPRAIGSGSAGSGLALGRRRRRLAVAVGSRGLLAILALAVPNLPCQFPGGDSCPPADDAERAGAGRRARLRARQPRPRDRPVRDARRARRPGAAASAARSPTRAAGLIPGPSGGAVDFDARHPALVRRRGGDRGRCPAPAAAGAGRPARGRRRRGRRRVRRPRSPGRAAQTEEYHGIEVSDDDAGSRDRAGRGVPGDRLAGTACGRSIDVATGADGPSRSPTTSTPSERPRRASRPRASPRPGCRRTGSRADRRRAAALLARSTPLLAPGATERRRGVAERRRRRARARGPQRARPRARGEPRRASSPPSRRSSPSCPSACAARRSPTSASATRQRRCASCSPRRPPRRRGSPTGFEDLLERLRDRAASTSRTSCCALGDEAAFAVALVGAGAAAAGTPESARPTAAVPAVRRPASTRTRPARRSPRSRARSPTRSRRRARCRRRSSAAAGRRRRRAQPAGLADGRAHLRGLRRARRDRHRPGRGRATLAAGDGGLDEDASLRAGDRRTSPTSPRCSPTSTSAGWSTIGERSGLAEDPAYAHLRRRHPPPRRARPRGLAAPTTSWRPTRDCCSARPRRLARTTPTPARPTEFRLTSPPMTIKAWRQRVPVHLRVGHRGAPRQGRRPDLRRRPRRGPARRPVRPRRLRDAGQHRPRGRLRRDLDRDLRRHPGDRPRDDPPDRLHRRRPRLLGRLLRGASTRSTSSRPTSPRASTTRSSRAPTRPTTTSSTSPAPATRG